MPRKLACCIEGVGCVRDDIIGMLQMLDSGKFVCRVCMSKSRQQEADSWRTFNEALLSKLGDAQADNSQLQTRVAAANEARLSADTRAQHSDSVRAEALKACWRMEQRMISQEQAMQAGLARERAYREEVRAD